MKTVRIVALAGTLLLVLSGCGGDEPGAGSTPPATTTGTPTTTTTPTPTPTDTGPSRTGRTVDVIDNAFVPAELTVTVGTEVIWTQSGTATHTVTASDGSFDSHPDCPNDLSACMKPGESFRRSFLQAGTFTYACKVHGQLMSGTIVVE